MVSDDFNRADSGTLGANWTNVAGSTWGVVSNRAALGATGGFTYWNAVGFDSTQSSQAVYAETTARTYAAAARVQSGAATGYVLYMNGPGNALNLSKVVAGAETLLGSSIQLGATNDVLKVDCNGTTITPTVNGAAISGLGAQTDSAITGGAPGMWTDPAESFGTGLDDWQGTGEQNPNILSGFNPIKASTRRPAAFSPGLAR